MAEPSTDRLEVGAGCDQMRAMRVTQIVQPDARQIGFPYEPIELL